MNLLNEHKIYCKVIDSIGRKNIKLKLCGNIVETAEFDRVNKKAPVIKKIGAELWVNQETGEMFDLKNKNREFTIKRSMGNMRDIINANCVECSNIHFVTLTYKVATWSMKELYTDFTSFMKRFYYYVEHNLMLEKPKYINVIEPNEKNNRWHFHLLLIWNKKAPYIKNDILNKIWDNGFVKINDIDNVDNIGAYLSAYLTNDKKESGEICKGNRLHLYPNGINFYRCSKNITKPVIKWLSASELSYYVKDLPVTYKRTKKYEINDEINEIKYTYYNKIRNK